MVAAGIADEILIQISYAIGIAQPVGIFVNTYGTAKVNLNDTAIAEKISSIFDLRPKAIEERLKLRNLSIKKRLVTDTWDVLPESSKKYSPRITGQPLKKK